MNQAPEPTLPLPVASTAHRRLLFAVLASTHTESVEDLVLPAPGFTTSWHYTQPASAPHVVGVVPPCFFCLFFCPVAADCPWCAWCFCCSWMMTWVLLYVGGGRLHLPWPKILAPLLFRVLLGCFARGRARKIELDARHSSLQHPFCFSCCCGVVLQQPPSSCSGGACRDSTASAPLSAAESG